MLGADEAQHLPDIARLHEVDEQAALRFLRQPERALRNRLGGGVAPRNIDQARLVQQLIGKPLDLAEVRARGTYALQRLMTHGDVA